MAGPSGARGICSEDARPRPESRSSPTAAPVSGLELSSTQPEAPPADPAGTALLVVGAGHFQLYPVPDRGELTIGRDAGCAVPLAHSAISRRHARVWPAPEKPRAVVLQDLGSTNGVLVEGRRLEAGHPIELGHGASFAIGPFTVVVTWSAEPSPLAGTEPSRELNVHDPTPAGVSPVVGRLARSPVNVLVLGETGAGKEVLARTIHELSGRPGRFVGINAAALSEALLESELFGHERGAFTGAHHAKAGLLEIAAGGTVFLDEIGELPLPSQAKLLRALETRQVYRVGGTQPVELDVRFLAATNRDLGADVAAGRFRSDLYYRLHGVSLRVAPLRERRGAISGLARRFLAEAAAAAGRPAPPIGLDAMARLVRHDWPGNVRELRAVMERAFALADDAELGAGAIWLDADAALADPGARFGELAARHRGNVTLIARDLATSRSQVRRLARRHGVSLDRLRGG